MKSEMMDIKSIQNLLNKREASCVELTKMYLDRINSEYSKKLNAYITICEEIAIKQAKEVDSRIATNSQKLLDGVMLGVKDLFCTEGVLTTSASKMLSNFIPQYESTVTKRLFEKGCVMLGKTNMDEFAMGSSGLHSYYGATLSPWKDETGYHLSPGGSSSGSAAAVSAGLCIAATGSDTGGSVRQPAAFCGLVGFKPSYGRISRFGMVAYSSSFDQAGFLTRTVYDSALLTYATAGKDGMDSTLFYQNPEEYHNILDSKNQKQFKIGISEDFFNGKINEEIKASFDELIKNLESLGIPIKLVKLPHVKYSINVYYFISTAEASSNLARYDGIRYGYRTDKDLSDISDFISLNRGEGFGEEVKNRIILGTKALLKDSYEENFEKILKLRQLIKDDYNKVFEEVDVILLPTTGGLAPKFDQKLDQIEEYLSDFFTVSANIASIPAISIPISMSKSGRPIGLQVFGKQFEDAKVLQFASFIEKIIDFNKKFEHNILNTMMLS